MVVSVLHMQVYSVLVGVYKSMLNGWVIVMLPVLPASTSCEEISKGTTGNERWRVKGNDTSSPTKLFKFSIVLSHCRCVFLCLCVCLYCFCCVWVTSIKLKVKYLVFATLLAPCGIAKIKNIHLHQEHFLTWCATTLWCCLDRSK